MGREGIRRKSFPGRENSRYNHRGRESQGSGNKGRLVWPEWRGMAGRVRDESEEFPGLAGHRRTWPGEPLKGLSTREIHLAESRLWGGEGVQEPRKEESLSSKRKMRMTPEFLIYSLKGMAFVYWNGTVAGRNLGSETTKTSDVDLSVFEMPFRHPSRDIKAGKS